MCPSKLHLGLNLHMGWGGGGVEGDGWVTQVAISIIIIIIIIITIFYGYTVLLFVHFYCTRWIANGGWQRESFWEIMVLRKDEHSIYSWTNAVSFHTHICSWHKIK